MQHCLIKLLLIFIPSLLLSKNIIFVHLGDTPPPCIFTCIEQARFFNEECAIYLITDNKSIVFFQGNTILEKLRIQLINADLVPFSQEHINFRLLDKLDFSISKGFWVYTTERFFTLLDFIKKEKLTDIVHLESDTMLYMDLEELTPLFSELKARIAAPFQSLKGCIPCFVFIKDSDSLSLLIDHMLCEMTQYEGRKSYLNLNDMQTLASFYVKFGQSYLLPLPTLMHDYSKFIPKGKSRYAPDNLTPLSFLSLNADVFQGYIFDAAGLAIYINGNDERFSKGHGPKTIHSRLLFNPGVFSYFWDRDSKERIVPSIQFKQKKYRIVNLHFHSKKPEDYTSFLQKRNEFL